MKQYMGITLHHETDQVASHQPALIWALENTTGAILELGVGNSSTELIHTFAQKHDRDVVSIEDSPEWIGKFMKMESNRHRFILVERSVQAWMDIINNQSDRKWGVVFVDQGHGEDIWRPTRNYAVNKLVACADYIVAHDADIFPEMINEEFNCGIYEPTIKAEPSRRGPPTHIFSKNHKLDGITIKE